MNDMQEDENAHEDMDMDVDETYADEAEEDPSLVDTVERKRLRMEPRELLMTPEIGLGNNDAGDELGGFFAIRRTPWQDRSYSKRVILTCPSSVAWLNDRNAQLHFAQKFAVPLREDECKLRALASDVFPADATTLEPNYTAKVLHTLTSTGHRTLLELMRSCKYDVVCASQFHTDRRRDYMIDRSPNGGLQGLSNMVLWRISSTSQEMTFNEELLKIASLFAEGLRENGELVMWPACATEWSEPITTPGSRCVGARVSTQNLSEIQRVHTHTLGMDLDAMLAGKIAEFRQQLTEDGRFNPDSIVPVERQVCCCTFSWRGMCVAAPRHCVCLCCCKH